VTNYPQRDAALVRRGSLTVWFTEETVAAWYAPASGERGGQPVYSAIAIETGVALRVVFHWALGQTEGLLRSISEVPRVDIGNPDHTTISRRGGGLKILPTRRRATVVSTEEPNALRDVRLAQRGLYENVNVMTEWLTRFGGPAWKLPAAPERRASSS
jgi:hypothetical protein